MHYFSTLNCGDLHHPTKQISTEIYFSTKRKNFLYCPKKQTPKMKKVLCSFERTDLFPQEKFLKLTWKKTIFQIEGKNSYAFTKKGPKFIWKKQIFRTKINEISDNFFWKKEFLRQIIFYICLKIFQTKDFSCSIHKIDRLANTPDRVKNWMYYLGLSYHQQGLTS